jgi:phosphoadenosine phosphosulfate reductase
MLQALRAMDCWITGRKRHQADARQGLPRIEAQGRWITANPLAGWSARDLSAYYETHDLPPHPLRAQGYPSAGCAS